MQTIQIAIADDMTLFREGLIALLSPEEDFSILGEAATGREAVAICVKMHPHVLLLDLKMPEMDGLEVISELRAVAATTAILAMADEAEEYCLVRREGNILCGGAQDCLQLALRRGARGCIRKNIYRDDLVKAIRAVAAGHIWTENQTASRWVQLLVNPSYEMDKFGVTDRERDVLIAVAQGLSNKEIAAQLVLSPQTVKNHISHLLEKLELEDRTQLALFAVEHGFDMAAK